MAKKKDIPVYTHAQLVEKATWFLRHRARCHAVLAEMNILDGEIPDAIGWTYGNHCTLIEVKVSRSDFHADKEKIFRIKPSQGMGMFRYFMAPKGMLTEADLCFAIHPKFPESVDWCGWGLLEVDSAGRIFMTKKSKRFDTRNRPAEARMMIGALRRVSLRLAQPLHEYIRPVQQAVMLGLDAKKPFKLEDPWEDENLVPWHDADEEYATL